MNGNVAPRKPGGLKKRNRFESRKRILQAGLEVFSELGYDAATTKMIAARAGLNESLLHRYFESKEGLLLEVNKLCLEAIKNQKPYPPQETLEEEIYRFLTEKLEFDEKNRNFIRIIISRALVDEQLRKTMNKQMDHAPDGFLKERLYAFQNKGLLRKDLDIEGLFYLFLAMGFSVGLMERIVFNKSISHCKKRFRAFARNICGGITR